MTQEFEAPQSFIRWSAYAAIAGVVRKNVYLDKFAYKLYPNIYVLLNAKSGGRKGFPIGLAKKLVKSCCATRLVSGRNSIQAIIRDLSKAYTLEGGGIIKEAHAFIVSGEFHALLIEDKSAFGVLTELYNTQEFDGDTWENNLKGAEKPEKLIEPCLTLLGASNDAMLKDALPEYAIEGGFLGRMLMIPDDRTGIINPLTRKPKVEFKVDSLIPHLLELSKLKGEFHYNDISMDMFEKWYKPLRVRAIKSEDATGTINRLHDQVLKVAMILSLARGTDLIINEEDLDQAIIECQAYTTGLKIMGEAKGKAEYANAQRIILERLVHSEGYTIEKNKILRDHWGAISSAQCVLVQDHLKEAGYLEIDMVDGKMHYRLTQLAIDRYTSLKND